MDIISIIVDKKDGKALTKEQIHFFIRNYIDKKIEDYQASALLMAITINGMNSEETAILTEEMRVSGDVWDLSDIPGLKVDKHSTGGCSMWCKNGQNEWTWSGSYRWYSR